MPQPSGAAATSPAPRTDLDEKRSGSAATLGNIEPAIKVFSKTTAAKDRGCGCFNADKVAKAIAVAVLFALGAVLAAAIVGFGVGFLPLTLLASVTILTTTPGLIGAAVIVGLTSIAFMTAAVLLLTPRKPTSEPVTVDVCKEAAVHYKKFADGLEVLGNKIDAATDEQDTARKELNEAQNKFDEAAAKNKEAQEESAKLGKDYDVAVEAAVAKEKAAKEAPVPVATPVSAAPAGSGAGPLKSDEQIAADAARNEANDLLKQFRAMTDASLNATAALKTATTARDALITRMNAADKKVEASTAELEAFRKECGIAWKEMSTIAAIFNEYEIECPKDDKSK